MNEAMTLIKKYVSDESGATAIEYGLIAGLVGLSLVVGSSKLASNNNSAWSSMAEKVENVG